LYTLKTTATTVEELENDIKSKFKLEGNTKFDLEIVRNGSFFVLDDIEDLEEGMRIKVSGVQTQQNLNKIDGNLLLLFFFFQKSHFFIIRNFKFKIKAQCIFDTYMGKR